jgi:hypothetical protein
MPSAAGQMAGVPGVEGIQEGNQIPSPLVRPGGQHHQLLVTQLLQTLEDDA